MVNDIIYICNINNINNIIYDKISNDIIISYNIIYIEYSRSLQ